jgi:hypothetical protein
MNEYFGILSTELCSFLIWLITFSFEFLKFLEIKKTSGSGFFGNFQRIDSFYERTGKEPPV